MLKKFAVLFFVVVFLLTPAYATTLREEEAPPSREFLEWQKNGNNSHNFDKSSENEPYATGDVPSPIDRSHLNRKKTNLKNFDKSTNLPVSYDIRENSWLPDVRNQNPFGSCWIHAGLASLESSYLSQNLGSDIDLSEFHVAYFVYGDTRPGKSFILANDGEI